MPSTRLVRVVKHPKNLPWYVEGWNTGGNVYIMWPWQMPILSGVGRAWHELEEIINSDPEDHAWWHFCVKSVVPFRKVGGLFGPHDKGCHGGTVTRDQVNRLLEDGFLEW